MEATAEETQGCLSAVDGVSNSGVSNGITNAPNSNLHAIELGEGVHSQAIGSTSTGVSSANLNNHSSIATTTSYNLVSNPSRSTVLDSYNPIDFDDDLDNVGPSNFEGAHTRPSNFEGAHNSNFPQLRNSSKMANATKIGSYQMPGVAAHDENNENNDDHSDTVELV
jgi:hypothetical protein